MQKQARPLELFTTEKMYQADQMAAENGISGVELMYNAGRAVFEEICHHFPKARVSIFCGPGNNGGDGFVIAQLLYEAGWSVNVVLMTPSDSFMGDAKFHLDRLSIPSFNCDDPEVWDCEVVVDALFGAGLSRPVGGEHARVIAAINELGKPVISVDIPSGIDGDTGEVRGIAIEATRTVTFERSKIGHHLYPGKHYVGDLSVCSIGIPKDVIQSLSLSVSLNDPKLWSGKYPWPDEEGHKFKRGHGVIISGDQMTGAARLAALNARRVGMGVATIWAPDEAAARIHRVDQPGNIVTTEQIQQVLGSKKIQACLVGPGLGRGEWQKDLVKFLWDTDLPLVVDADAINLLGYIQPSRRVAPTILTPHEGEFARLFPNLEGSKVKRALEGAERLNATLLLKGADTVIAQATGDVRINDLASPWLATAGSGDCLAGICLGLLAMGMSPFDSAAMAAWVHGSAGKRLGPGLIAEDIEGQLPLILQDLAQVKRKK